MRFVKNYLKENLKWLLLVLACFGILCFVIGFEQVPLARHNGDMPHFCASFCIYW